jgi:hypothetical protein
MSVSPSPLGGFASQFFDNNGVILSGGKIYTYVAGLTTPQATYTSASGVTPHANPIILDSAGRVPGGEIWLTDGADYKFVIETSTGSLLGTYDDITGINAVLAELASTAVGEGASLVGIHDAENYYTATTVEGALQELGSTLPITNILALRAETWPSGRPTQAQVISNWATGDGGGVFRWDGASTATDDGGVIIKETAVTTGRWIRQFSGQGVVSSWFSATVHTGVQTAIDAGYDYILLPNFVNVISWTGTVTLPQSRRITVESGGKTIFVNPNIFGFKFLREIAAVSGATFTFKGNGGLVVENGLARTSIFIDFRGVAVSAGVSITRIGSTATVTLPSPHFLSSGQTIEISGANQVEYNGRFVCTVTGANTLTYTVSGTPATPATGNICFSGFETANYNDNRVTVENAEFRGFFRCFYTERCGGNFNTLSSRFNGIMWESGRDSSFMALSDILSVNDITTIYYLDTYPNGLSNGVSLDRVYSVLAGGSGSQGGIYMVGIEGMTGQSNSIDLSFGATYSLTLILCTSLALDFVWIASDLTQNPSHRNWYLQDAFRSTLSVKNNVNATVFGWVESATTPASPLYLSLTMPLFYGPANAGIIFNNAIGVSVEPGYKFTNAMPRTSSDYEFFGAGTCNYNTIGQGQMRGASYSIAPNIGANSVVVTPVFIP